MSVKDKLQEYALIAEIISAFAIVASLVFVGLQIDQSNDLAQSEARQTWNAYVGDSYLSLAENEELAAILHKDFSNEPLTDLEQFRFTVFWQRVFNINNLAFYELAPSDLRLQEANIRANFESFPSLPSVWESRNTRYPPDFVTWMDGLRIPP